MSGDNIAISLDTSELEIVNDLSSKAEVKMNWADIQRNGIFEEEENFSDILDLYNVDESDILDIHLPPGTSSNPGLTATRDNVGELADFSYSKCGENDQIFFTTHAPKKYDFLDQMWVFDKLFKSLDGREISIENNSAVSKWYEKEQISFWGYCGSNIESMSDLYLTVDSAHLPQDSIVQDGRKNTDNSLEVLDKLNAVNSVVIDDMLDDLDDGDIDRDEVSNEFLQYINSNVEEFEDEVGSNYFVDVPEDDEYVPLAQVVAMNGERIRTIHLNDPETNNLPDLNQYKNSQALRDTIDFVEDRDIYLVAEPEGETSYNDAIKYEDTLSKMINN